VAGEVLLLTSLCLVMPEGDLVWYFSMLSYVKVIYGTLATAVEILHSLEAAALILLLGAQVIAACERIGMEDDREGLHT
jgi:membrane protein